MSSRNRALVAIDVLKGRMFESVDEFKAQVFTGPVDVF